MSSVKRLFIALLLSAATAVQTATAATAIRDVRLFDGTRVIPKATVVFDRGLIIAAGPNVAIPDGAEVIDGSGKTLLPGFIDSHTHSWGPALARALRFGVTTNLDMFTMVDLMKQWHAEQAAGPVTNRADIHSAGILVTVKGGHGAQYTPIPTYAPGDDAQAFIDARIADGSDFIKIVKETGEAYGIHFETLKADDLKALIPAAHKRKKMAVVHIGSLADARMAIDAGADGLVHIFGDRPPDAEFGKLVAAHRAFVVPTLTVLESASGNPSGASLTTDARVKPFLNGDEIANLKTSFPKRAASKVNLAHAQAAVRQLKEARVPILAGSDAPNPGTTHGASIHRELELLVEAGLTPTEALAAATSAPAKAFKLEDRGRIAKGLRADLVLVNGDPTASITATRDIAAIWKNGVRLQRQPETPSSQAEFETLAPEKLAAGIVSNFDSGTAKLEFGSDWFISTDQMANGKSTATMTVVDGGAAGTPKALHVVTEINESYASPWAGAMAYVGSTEMKPVDLSSKKGLTFFAKGNTDIRVMVFAKKLGRIPAQTTVHAGSDWTELTVLWSDLKLEGNDVQAVLFSGISVGKSEFTIDEVRLKSP
jgi:imidazolonepropionase-like amidohydrolase